MTGSTVAPLDALCDGLASAEARTRYGSARQFLRLSEQDPAQLYPRFDFFVRLLDSPARVLRWNAARILGNLARADTEGRIEPLLDRFLSPICGPEMIGAANVIQGAAAIAVAKPQLAGRIAEAIVGVRHARYATTECRYIAAGHAIQALDRFFASIPEKQPVVAFVHAQLRCPRAATRKKAERFCRKWAATIACRASRAQHS